MYPYDIAEFFVGGTARNVARRWSGDFEGRPHLALQFKHFLERDQLSDASLDKRVGCARHFFRFVDERPDLPTVSELAELTEEHGPQLKRWLSDRGITSPDVYKNIKKFVVEGRNSQACHVSSGQHAIPIDHRRFRSQTRSAYKG
ncbi:hypothetical protein [Methylobrevis albus]|uniref:Uncharacterized protein n=1 Tax=Methylobrevis albus TaxID=2793297 RepID=A0A931I6E0_9HYPH|nr:hypothetical protein [Methylobrevis albus]MBH0240020.1 hypothetical protein [Methylobrevis albus]